MSFGNNVIYILICPYTDILLWSGIISHHHCLACKCQYNFVFYNKMNIISKNIQTKINQEHYRFFFFTYERLLMMLRRLLTYVFGRRVVELCVHLNIRLYFDTNDDVCVFTSSPLQWTSVDSQNSGFLPICVCMRVQKTTL